MYFFIAIMIILFICIVIDTVLFVQEITRKRGICDKKNQRAAEKPQVVLGYSDKRNKKRN